jgi:hypothetical protein
MLRIIFRPPRPRSRSEAPWGSKTVLQQFEKLFWSEKRAFSTCNTGGCCCHSTPACKLMLQPLITHVLTVILSPCLSGAVAASQRRGGATARKHAGPEFPELTEMGTCCRPVTVLHGSYMHTQGLKMIVRVCAIIRRVYKTLICSGSMPLQRLCDPLRPDHALGAIVEVSTH